MKRQGFVMKDGDLARGSGAWSAVPALLVSMVALGACGSSAATPATNADSGTDSGVGQTVGSIVRGPVAPCTEPHSICVSAKMPASLTTTPTMLQIDLYAVLPPTHPPDVIPLAIATPDLVGGETVQLRMTDLGNAGTYHFLGIVFMPGGGHGIPVQGLDYTGNSMVSYPLTGAALNIPETLDFQFAP